MQIGIKPTARKFSARQQRTRSNPRWWWRDDFQRFNKCYRVPGIRPFPSIFRKRSLLWL